MKTTIEINGKIYDSRTGKVIAPGESPKVAQQDEKIERPLEPGKIMDGITRSRAPVLASPKTSSRFAQAQSSVNPRIQRSKTLNRKAVKKPATKSLEPVVLKKQAPTTRNVSSVVSRVEKSATGRGMLLKRTPDARLSRAMSLKRNSLVSKFNTTPKKSTILTNDLSVSPKPKESNSAQSHLSTSNPKLEGAPDHNKTTAFSKTQTNLLERRILLANSHVPKDAKKKHKNFLSRLRKYPKVISTVATIIAVFAIGGFFAYQRVPEIGLKIAANKVGFEGRIPDSIPAGFSYHGPVQTEAETVAITYRSIKDEKQFVLSQRPTSWSSESLLSNFLTPEKFRYQIYKNKGLVVYIFNDSNATWIDRGIWFTVSGQKSELTSEQLLEIASST